MKKDFNLWNNRKKEIHFKERPVFYHQREVWWCSLGINVGSEQDGTGKNFDRPVLIIKGFNSNSFLGIALTGKKKEGKYYIYLGKIEGRDSTAILSQIRLIDSKRLIRKIKTIEEPLFIKLKTALQAVLLN